MRSNVLLLLFAASSPTKAPEVWPSVKVVRLEERHIPFPDRVTAAAPPRVQLAWFENGEQLRWDGREITNGSGRPCEGAPTERSTARRARLARPRVEEWNCASPRGVSTRSLKGFDDQGRVRWERSLAMQSGDVAIPLWLIGATADGLILSDLEVWSPTTGETRVPPTTHLSGGRRVPDHQYSVSALYLAASREMLVFHADVTVLRRVGGVYRIGLESGRQELWLPVTATLLGTYDRVETMTASSDGRLAIFGLRQVARGPNAVGVAVYDLATRKLLFSERFCGGHVCSAPQIVAGADGHFAFAFRDDNAREHVLVHYRSER